MVTEYLTRSGLLPYLEKVGFYIVGYGCTTCIGNSGPLPDSLVQAIEGNELVCAAVISGNRNFEGRIHPNIRANYLASPPLVVAYAIAGTTVIDYETEPLGTGSDGKPVFLRDIWPSHAEVAEGTLYAVSSHAFAVVSKNVLKEMFLEVYSKVTTGTEQWNSLKASNDLLYPWDSSSTYIHHPPYFDTMTRDLNPVLKVSQATVLLNLGDSITTDHISPAGNISRKSPAGRFLEAHG